MPKTRYRIYSEDGTFLWLQYEYQYRLFNIKLYKGWKNIPYPTKEKVLGISELDFARDVTDWTWESPYNYHGELKDFPKRFPNIEDYFKEFYNPRMKGLEVKVKNRREKRKEETKTKYLDE